MSATTTTTTPAECQTCQKPRSELKCSTCNATYYCNTDCQTADKPQHETRCKFLQNHPPNEDPNSIPCVIILGPANLYAITNLSSSHSIFNTQPLPITQKFGYPLVMVCGDQGSSNQHATWMSMDPETGAVREDCVRNAIIANADGTPLSVDTLEAITDYVSDIRKAFRDGEGPPTSMYNRARLDEYIQDRGGM